MESNEQTERRKYGQTHRWRAGRQSVGEEGGKGVEGLNKKEKGLMDMDNRVVIAGGETTRGLNGNGKNIIKIK